MKYPTYKREQEFLGKGYDAVIGCDEAGVGPLAGPVVAAACVLDPESMSGKRSRGKWFYRIRDSKTTYENERGDLVLEIKKHCLAYGIGEASVQEIDSINIRNAALLAMKRAVEKAAAALERLNPAPAKVFLFLDGRSEISDLSIDNLEQAAIIKADSEIVSVSAASILAKEHRDALMKKLSADFPDYGFDANKGYGTKRHLLAIRKNGASRHHRKSFLKNLI